PTGQRTVHGDSLGRTNAGDGWIRDAGASTQRRSGPADPGDTLQRGQQRSRERSEGIRARRRRLHRQAVRSGSASIAGSRSHFPFPTTPRGGGGGATGGARSGAERRNRGGGGRGSRAASAQQGPVRRRPRSRPSNTTRYDAGQLHDS